MLDITYDDSDSSGDISTDNIGGETIQYDPGTGVVSTVVDSLVVVTLTVTYTNGSSQAFSNAVMYQDGTGNLFLTNSNFAGTDLNGPNNLPIESVSVTAITGDSYTGLYNTALQSFICFAADTLILTPAGAVAIETLRPGDLITTMDHGDQPLRWTGVRQVAVGEKIVPVRVAAGALAGGLPGTDLLVTQQHRLFVRSRIAERMFRTREVLIPAKRFLGLEGFSLERGRTHMAYAHLLFDRYEIVFANGAPAESLLPGPQALRMMGPAARAEILAIFPELAAGGGIEPARLVPPGAKQRALCARHDKNAAGCWNRSDRSGQGQRRDAQRDGEAVAPDPDLVEIGDVETGGNRIDLLALVRLQERQRGVLVIAVLAQRHMRVRRAVEVEIFLEDDHPLPVQPADGAMPGGDVVRLADEGAARGDLGVRGLGGGDDRRGAGGGRCGLRGAGGEGQDRDDGEGERADHGQLLLSGFRGKPRQGGRGPANQRRSRPGDGPCAMIRVR